MQQLTFDPGSDIPDRTPANYHGKKRIVKTCKVDGKPFLIAPGLAKRYTVCSDACKLQDQLKPLPEEKLCTGPCGRVRPLADFYIERRSGRPVPDCKECRADKQRDRVARLKEENAARPAGPIPDRTPLGWPSKQRVERACTVCDGPYLISPSIASHYQTCSDECASERKKRDRRRVSAAATEKRCTRCGETKPRAAFSVRLVRQRLYLSGWCNDCDTPEARSKQATRRVSARDAGRRRVLGLTQEEWHVLLPTLRTDCAVCGTKVDLCADHDHKTRLFRDMLCRRHNSAIGLANDDPGLLRKLADYLEFYRDNPRSQEAA